MNNQAKQRWDIFCHIVDNFGDIGVCWRLSQQLAHEQNIQVRLFIDDLVIASKIIPHLNYKIESQTINDIEVCTWQIAEISKPAEVALETFSCELPSAYLANMPKDSVWINLEYLSAESWVADFHARSSNNTQRARHFYFPGFTQDTGGLIRERGLLQKNISIANGAQLQIDFLRTQDLVQTDTLKVSLFCYPHAPIIGLLNAMIESKLRIDCYVPASSILPNVASFFNLESIEVGSKLHKQNLHLHVLPFLTQDDYDALLAICDINFVRGEDSWIRAIWAGKPFIWQPYLQTENTHVVKLKAFLTLFYADCAGQIKDVIEQAHLAWLGETFSVDIWKKYVNQLHTIKPVTLHKSRELATQTDLAAKLVIFLQKLRVKV